MATTPEGRVKRAINKVLAEFGVRDMDGDKLSDPELYYFMPVQTGLGKRTLDYLVCYRCVFIAIEAKAPGKKPTAIQEITIREIKSAGGEVFVIGHYEPDTRGYPGADTLNDLRDYLQELKELQETDNDDATDWTGNGFSET